ncbi:hypothetical protein VZ94_18740 [Methylocucumis oryzae]|uniref:RDD domain-containing protein n=2 Tax=Methylocucumis oryzae TaxID=1632867 RepID=A0A0F3IFA1_9GAMM|nr:hypothetical protein VZ94_18740 [Methylocucumis oryzae]
MAKNSSDNDYLAVQTLEGLDYQLEIAGLGARSHAFIIDWHIRLLLALLWLIVGTGLLGLFAIENLREWWRQISHTLPLIIVFLPTAAIYFLYHPVLEIIMAGRTPGKRMAGVRLVTLQGHTPRAGEILLRNVFRLIDSLPSCYVVGIVTVALTHHHVRIGDLAAGLVLVYETNVSANTLNQVTQLAIHSELTPEQQGLLLDLLNRWPELNKNVRIDLAQKFLAHIGRPVTNLDKVENLDRALHIKLQRFFNRVNAYGNT